MSRRPTSDPGTASGRSPGSAGVGGRFTPTLVKGIGFALGGLAVLLAPRMSFELVRVLTGAVLLVTGLSGIWGHVRGAGRRWEVLGRGLLAIAAGLALLLIPGLLVRTVSLVAAVYVGALGLVGLRVALLPSDDRPARRNADAGRAAILLLLSILLVFLPVPLLGLAVATAAAAAVLVGLVMVAWSLRHGAREPRIANRAEASEVLLRWLRDRDVGTDRRDAVADGLYFEEPGRTAKVVSYIVMLSLSAALAALAVLQDSTAVIIGAMLVAPLMTPIMGCAAGLVAGWRRRVLRSLAVVALSIVAAVGLAWTLAAWVPALVPFEANSQVLSRTAPTLLDMAIALTAGAAGAYATIDDRVSSSLTGVAIAVALVPPLSVVGITLEAGHGAQALGAFLLFATNLVSIILASVLVFVLTGFSPFGTTIENRSANADLFSTVMIGALLIVLPLGLTGQSVLERSRRAEDARRAVAAWLGPSGALRLMSVETTGSEVRVELTGSGKPPEVEGLATTLSQHWGAPVRVRVEVLPSTTFEAEARPGLTGDGVATGAPDPDGSGP